MKKKFLMCSMEVVKDKIDSKEDLLSAFNSYNKKIRKINKFK